MRGERQREEPAHWVAVVGEVHHRLEDAADRARPDLVPHARGVQRARGGSGPAGPVGEGVEELLGVLAGVVGDLAAQEAVLGCEVALDVDEAQDAAGVPVREQQSRQPAHGVADEVEPLDPGTAYDVLGGAHQERDRHGREVRALGLAAARRVVREEAPSGERCLAREVRVVFLRRAEPVEEHHGLPVARTGERRHGQLHPVDGDLPPTRVQHRVLAHCLASRFGSALPRVSVNDRNTSNVETVDVRYAYRIVDGVLIRDLDWLLALAEHEHVTDTAALLRTSQPTLSRALARVEGELGARVFERAPDGVHLTPPERSCWPLRATSPPATGSSWPTWEPSSIRTPAWCAWPSSTPSPPPSCRECCAGSTSTPRGCVCC